jgi:hypothetical protein
LFCERLGFASMKYFKYCTFTYNIYYVCWSSRIVRDLVSTRKIVSSGVANGSEKERPPPPPNRHKSILMQHFRSKWNWIFSSQHHCRGEISWHGPLLQFSKVTLIHLIPKTNVLEKVRFWDHKKIISFDVLYNHRNSSKFLPITTRGNVTRAPSRFHAFGFRFALSKNMALATPLPKMCFYKLVGGLLNTPYIHQRCVRKGV